jgi:hypothetical protein
MSVATMESPTEDGPAQHCWCLKVRSKSACSLRGRGRMVCLFVSKYVRMDLEMHGVSGFLVFLASYLKQA